jgi:hypothetical protein
MCDGEGQQTVLRLFARPTADLYVDLQWITLGDQIRTDVGYGRGADLNLHLTATDDDHLSPNWGDKYEACLGFGEYPTGEAGERYDTANCSSSGAEIHSLSVSGAHREIMTVAQTNRRYYHIGAQVWSIADFYANAQAKVTIWANGRKIDSHEWVNDQWATVLWAEGDDSDDQIWANEPPPDEATQDEMLQRTYLLGKENFWPFAVWDAQEQELLLYPFRRFNNTFP